MKYTINILIESSSTLLNNLMFFFLNYIEYKKYKFLKFYSEVKINITFATLVYYI